MYGTVTRRPMQANRTFYRNLLAIALPVAGQNLLVSSLSFVDTFMIGRLGSTEVAAVGLGNQIFFLFVVIMYGVGSGASVFISQYCGKKDIPNIRRSIGICLSSALGVSVLFSAGSLFLPEQILSIFSTDPMVVGLGSTYLRIVGISYLFSAVSLSFSFTLRSVEQARIPFIVSAIALSINTVGNYVLIFGKAGFPAMGVAGAALSTTVSRGLEALIMLYFVYRRKIAAAGTIREFTDFGFVYLKRFFRTALPVILNEAAWATGMTMFKVVYARMGTESIAAINIAEAVINLLFVVLMGTANACAVMTGIAIGRGEREEAFQNGRRFLRLALVTGGVLALLSVATAPFIPGLFRVEDRVKAAVTTVLLIHAAYLPLKSLNLHVIIGLLRGGGDTRYGLFIDFFGVWCIGVPLAFAAAFLFHLPLPLVYALVTLEEAAKFSFGITRFRSKKWIRDLT